MSYLRFGDDTGTTAILDAEHFNGPILIIVVRFWPVEVRGLPGAQVRGTWGTHALMVGQVSGTLATRQRSPPTRSRCYMPMKGIKKPVGDSAGEDLDMDRGDYNAWIHVIFSVAYLFLAISAVAAVLLESLLHTEPNSTTRTYAVFVAASATLFSYWNRWRCIEAFSSRFCSGFMAFSFIFVPPISAIYAAYRGVLKLFGR